MRTNQARILTYRKYQNKNMEETKLFKPDPSTFGSLQFRKFHAINTQAVLTYIASMALHGTELATVNQKDRLASECICVCVCVTCL